MPCRKTRDDEQLQFIEQQWTVLNRLGEPPQVAVDMRSPLASVTPLRANPGAQPGRKSNVRPAECNMQSRAIRYYCCRPVNPLIYGDRRPPSPLTLRYSRWSPNMAGERYMDKPRRSTSDPVSSRTNALRLAGGVQPSFPCTSCLASQQAR